MSAKLSGKVSELPAETLASLKRLGFSDYESRIYIDLLRQISPRTAYEVAKSTGVPRPNTYNTLESLAQRGAVLAVTEGPSRYVAAPPRDLFSSIAEKTAALCSDIGTQLEDIAKPVDDQHVWTLSGEIEVHRKIDTLIRNCQDSLMLKAASDILEIHKPVLAEAGARGIEMLIIVFGPDPEEFTFGPRCRTYIHEANGVRMGSADNLFTLTVDHREMVTAKVSDTPVAVHTSNTTIVNLAESLVRHDYYMAEIFQKFAPQIDATFGPYLRDLRLGCFTPEQAASFRTKTGQ